MFYFLAKKKDKNRPYIYVSENELKSSKKAKFYKLVLADTMSFFFYLFILFHS